MSPHAARWLLKLIQQLMTVEAGNAPMPTHTPTTPLLLGQQDRHRQRGQLSQTDPCNSAASHLQLPEHMHPDISPGAAEAQGQKATSSTGKTGSHQLYVKLSWNCTIRTGTTWKRKLIALLFLIIQRQIDTSSETLARRYLFLFHNKVKAHTESEKSQNQHNNKKP